MNQKNDHQREEFTFYVYSAEWLKEKRKNVKEATYVKYYRILCCHILPVFGKYTPEEITTERIEEFTMGLLSHGKLNNTDGLSAKTVRDILTVLHSIIRYMRRKNISEAFQVEIRYPKTRAKSVRVLSREEQDILIRYLLCDMDPCKFGIFLALFTGLRIGEICALQWKNIHIREQMISITSTMQRLQETGDSSGKKTKIIITDPKSNTSVRNIPLNRSLLQLCIKMYPQQDDAFVLTGRAERYMEPRLLQYHLSRYTKECRLEQVHFHTLRHTFATRCVELGFEIKSLSEILGHSDTKITMNLYVHPSMELKRNNMQKLENIF